MVSGWQNRGDMNRALLVLFAVGVAAAIGTYWAYVSGEHGNDGRDAIYSACMRRENVRPFAGNSRVPRVGEVTGAISLKMQGRSRTDLVCGRAISRIALDTR